MDIRKVKKDRYLKSLGLAQKFRRISDRDEIESTLSTMPDSWRRALRDRALLVFLYNTGARVQEAADLRASNVYFEPNPSVRLHGKGDKWRVCPLWPETAALLKKLISEQRSTPTTIEIFHKSQRVASHLRAHGHGHAVTIAEHRPRSHQAHLEWTPSRMVNWAQTIGPNTARLFERILADKPHPEMGYRGCLGVIRLAEQYSTARMEAAAERALLTGACRYQSVKSILKNSLDAIPPAVPPSSPPPPPHDNIRGAEYFE